MNELINSVKKEEVAELPYKLDLQYFAEDDGMDEGSEGADLGNDEVDDTQDDQTDDTSVNNQDVADPDQSFKNDPQNQAFAQIRREKEQYERQLQSVNELISQQYGEEYGIHTFEEYQQALEAQQQEAERERLANAGLPEDVIEKLSKVDEVLQQAEQEKQNQVVLDNFNGLKDEYPDLVKDPKDIPPETWQKWDDGKTGLTLTEAFELTNKQAIRDQLTASTKQSTLNKINGKDHLRGNGGEGTDIALTDIPEDVLNSYRALFRSELRNGKMTEADFVKHYKKSLGQ